VKERGVVAPWLNLTEDELISKIASRLKVAGEGGSNNIKHPSSSGNAHGRGRSRGGGRGPPAADAAEMLEDAVVARSPMMSVATAGLRATGLANAGKRSTMNRCTPRRLTCKLRRRLRCC
jgi:hypothetical protein